MYSGHLYDYVFVEKCLEMCQYDTDAPAQGPSLPGNKLFATNEVEKGRK